MRIKSRNRYFIVTTIIALIVLLGISPLLFNYKRIFQIGYYHNEDSKSINYSSGRGIIYSKLDVDYQYQNIYYYNLQIGAEQVGSVDFNGFLSIKCRIFINDHYRGNINIAYSVPVFGIGRSTAIVLDKNDKVIFNLNITAQFKEQSQIHNETVSMSIPILVNYDFTDIHLIEMGFIWVYVFYFSSYIVIPLLLYLAFRPVFGIKDSDLDHERSRRIREFFSRRSNSNEDL